ncbi:MAG: DNA gyrase inhibitor YacG [Alphaproteobacteria bacterium]|nr:DNA gyrase inhibitor YacG [Alphaproteobacteria bacterium]
MTCPTCKKPSAADFKPFCSKRCREVDLNRWFTESYAVPAVELDDIDDDAMEEALRTADKNLSD